ncbi:hypothetical protein ACXJY6_12390 [Vibrio sp. RC27]
MTLGVEAFGIQASTYAILGAHITRDRYNTSSSKILLAYAQYKKRPFVVAFAISSIYTSIAHGLMKLLF